MIYGRVLVSFRFATAAYAGGCAKKLVLFSKLRSKGLRLRRPWWRLWAIWGGLYPRSEEGLVAVCTVCLRLYCLSGLGLVSACI